MCLLFIIIYWSILVQVNEGKHRFFCNCGPIHTRLRMFCNALNWAAAVATSPRSDCHGLRRSVIFQTVRDVLFQMCRENLIPLLVRGQICSAEINSLGKMRQRASGAQALLFQGGGVWKPITSFGLNVLPAAGSGHRHPNTSLFVYWRVSLCRLSPWRLADGRWLSAAYAGLPSVTLHSLWVSAHDTLWWMGPEKILRDCHRLRTKQRKKERKVNKHLLIKCCGHSCLFRAFRTRVSYDKCPVWMWILKIKY